MIAALQMYDWPEVAARTDAFWDRVAASLSAEGIAAPAALSRPGDLAAAWADPALLLGQSCGLPYVAGRCGGAGRTSERPSTKCLRSTPTTTS